MGSQCVAECVAKLVERGSSGIGGQCGRTPELGYALAPYSTMAVEPTLAYTRYWSFIKTFMVCKKRSFGSSGTGWFCGSKTKFSTPQGHQNDVQEQTKTFKPSPGPREGENVVLTLLIPSNPPGPEAPPALSLVGASA